VIIRNNIFSQNSVPIQLLSGSEAQFSIDHNLFDGPGGTYGTDPVIGNPKFVNPDGANFQLQSGSPAIDAGSSVDAPKVDFAGKARPQGAGYDLGAFEVESSTSFSWIRGFEDLKIAYQIAMEDVRKIIENSSRGSSYADTHYSNHWRQTDEYL
jgi:hypothetical protein